MNPIETKIRKTSKEFIVEVYPRIKDEQGEYKKIMELNSVQNLIEKLAQELDEIANNQFKSKKDVAIKTYEQNQNIEIKQNPPFVPVAIKEPIKPTINPIFKIQNFKINEEKNVKIDIESQEKISILDVKLPQYLGLVFNKESSEIIGKPITAGDFQISLMWSDISGAKSTQNLLLSVINDPKNLWKNIESDKNDPYFKPDKDAFALESDSHYICVGSIRGRSHAHVGSFRDDDFFIYSDDTKSWSVLIVADGAGSAKSSRKGSLLACQHAGNYIKNKIETEYDDIFITIAEYDSEKKERILREKFYYILGDAFRSGVNAIANEASIRGAVSKEYATTLLVAVCFEFENKLFIASAMIGDGVIGVYNKTDKSVVLLGIPDSGEFAGQTRFLDSSLMSDGSFWNRISVGFYDNPTALILMTDGISDPVFETDNGLKNLDLWAKLWKELEPIANDSSDNKKEKLLEWMNFFSPGHHDDRTIAFYGMK
jgi:serine/threonine protein phosphatase PrpC